MNWDSVLPIAIPVLVAIVSAVGSGSIVKVWIERDLTKAAAEKTITEGEVAQSQEHREWVRVAHEETAEVRTEAKRRIDEVNVEAKRRIDEVKVEAKERTEAAETRMAAAEKKAELAERKVRELERKVDELGDALREMKLRLRHCPGGLPCPIASSRADTKDDGGA